MCYEFEVLHKILPKLNSIHVPNNKYVQLVGKTPLQLLECLFLFRTHNLLQRSLDQSFFLRASLETLNETRLYLLKLYLLDLTNFVKVSPFKYLTTMLNV